MKILHLNSYLIDNQLYLNLYKKLQEKYGLDQLVYVPLKRGRKNPEIQLENIEFDFAHIIDGWHRVFYRRKIRKIFANLDVKIDISQFNFVHAHNWFVDGAVAYEIKRKYGLDFIVAVRSTDLQLQYRYMRHRRFYALQILRSAKNIIFISESYKKLFFQRIKDFHQVLKEKSMVIPNGVEDYWLEHRAEKTKRLSESKLLGANEIKVLFIGSIIPRKNLEQLIRAIAQLNLRGPQSFVLTIVGGEHPAKQKYFQSFLKFISTFSFVRYAGEVRDKDKLRSEIKEHDIFAMPSYRELFGLVYLEAMSQATPLLFSQDEGIDGMFPPKSVGIAVNPYQKEKIADGLESLLSGYEEFSENALALVQNFNWSSIAERYRSLYH